MAPGRRLREPLAESAPAARLGPSAWGLPFREGRTCVRAMRSGVRIVVSDMAGTTVPDDGLVIESFVAAAGHADLRAPRDELNARMGHRAARARRIG